MLSRALHLNLASPRDQTPASAPSSARSATSSRRSRSPSSRGLFPSPLLAAAGDALSDPDVIEHGVGMRIEQRGHGIMYVAAILEGGSAQLCKRIALHDELIKIDHHEIRMGDEVEKIRGLVLGPTGSTVRLTFQRPESQDVYEAEDGFHHVPTQQGIIRAYHEAYTVVLIRGPPHKPVREQGSVPINQEADVGLKKISPSKITRAALPPPMETISEDGNKATQELQALLRAIASLAPELESPTTAQEALPFVLQVKAGMEEKTQYVLTLQSKLSDSAIAVNSAQDFGALKRQNEALQQEVTGLRQQLVEEQETFELEKTTFKAQRAARGSREQELRNKIIARALARWTHLSLSGALSAWYSALQASRTQREAHRRLMARTVGRWTHQALAGAYALFTQHAAEQRRLRLVLARVVQRWRNGVLSAVFGSWREHANEHGRLERVCSKVMRKMRNTLANSALNKWQTSASQSINRIAVLKKVVTTWTHQLTCASFARWAEQAQKAAHMERVCSRMLLKMLNQRLSVALLTWREHAREQLRLSLLCTRIISKMLNGKLSMAFATWSDHICEQKRREDVCSRIVLKMMHRNLSMAFITWNSGIKDMQRQYNIIKKVVLRMQSALMCRALVSWGNYIAEQRRLTTAFTKTLLRMLNSRLASAFDGWVLKFVTVKHQLQIMRRATHRWCRQCLSAAFQTWYHHVAIASATLLAIRRIADLDNAANPASGQQTEGNEDRLNARTSSLPLEYLDLLGKHSTRLSHDLLQRWTVLAQTRADAMSGKACPRCKNGPVPRLPLDRIGILNTSPRKDTTTPIPVFNHEFSTSRSGHQSPIKGPITPSPTKLFRLQNSAYLGLAVTTTPPHAVMEVEDLMDMNMVKQGESGYSNEVVKPGDLILSIDGHEAQTASLDRIHEMLRGELHSAVALDLLRPGTNTVFTVRCCRHRNHEYSNRDVREIEISSTPRSCIQQTHWLATTPRASTSNADQGPIAPTQSPTKMRNSLLDDIVSPLVDAASNNNASKHQMKVTSLTELYMLKLHKAHEKLSTSMRYCSHLEALNDQLLLKRLEGGEVFREFNF
eukprot:Tamp_03354.p1 GENE.Tamp_03354~~Tamp_03354.p1  ORF type:complete len:1136 (-),score=161.54 Tamp_03354:370-3582(-)